MAVQLPVFPYFPEDPDFGVDPNIRTPGLDNNPLGNTGGSSGGGPSPSIVDNYKVKALLLNPALTSHYVCKFQPPGGARAYLSQGGFNYNNAADELISLSCSEASLPGSSLMTNEINDDFTGVTERHAYRRQYDDRIDFTFYVDNNYDIITFFERWISYCAGENDQNALNNKNYSYRVNFPKDYQADALYITKFERDITSSLEYKFIGAYPISITSMPISYDSSQLLKCTVSFTYIRYVRTVKKSARPSVTGEPRPTPSPGVTGEPRPTPSPGVTDPLAPRNPNDPLYDIINPPVATQPRPTPESFVVRRPTRAVEPVTATSVGVPNIPPAAEGASGSRGRSGPGATDVNQLGAPGLPIRPRDVPYNKAAGTGAIIQDTSPENRDESGTSSVVLRGTSSTIARGTSSVRR